MIVPTVVYEPFNLAAALLPTIKVVKALFFFIYSTLSMFCTGGRGGGGGW